MSTNIDNLDIDQLQELQKKTAKLIEKKQRENVDQAYHQLLVIAENVGMSLEALIEHGQQQQPSAKRTVAPRYRDLNDTAQTWTGRGKKPRWVVDALAQGKTLEDLAI